MDANKKKRIIIWTSVAIILSVGGYFGYKYLKDSGKLGGKKDGGDTDGGDTDGGDTGGGDTGGGYTWGGSTPTTEQTALATKYRIWANSTNNLSKKYGKKSDYDLDATRSNPYGGTFLRSYAAGKAEYEKYLKDQQAETDAASGSGGNNQIEQLAYIAGRYGRPLQKTSKRGQYVSINFEGELNGVDKYLTVIIKQNDSSGKNRAPYLVFALGERGNMWDDNVTKWLSTGFLQYNKGAGGVFTGRTAWGVGIGAKASSKYLSKALVQLTSNQLKITKYDQLYNS